MNPRYTLITATRPSCVTKVFSMDEGKLRKETSASLCGGFMEIMEVESAKDFASRLVALGSNQCLVYGVPPKSAQLVTEEEWKRLGQPEDAFPRSKSKFAWPGGPGILMLDYDAPKDGSPVMSRKELVLSLLEACPSLNDADFIWWPSTSSHIYHEEENLTGLKGQRIYLFVKAGTDIERAGEALNERLWSLGYGRYEVSTSGSLLKRGVFDSAVWQTNHIDFAAGARCGNGLSQRRGEPKVFANGSFRLLDTLTAIPDLTDTERAVAIENQRRCKGLQKEAAKKAREEWVRARQEELAPNGSEIDSDRVGSMLRRTAESQELPAEWPITIKDRNGTDKKIRVSDALDSPERFDGLLTLDPLEPEYDGGRFVGKLFLAGGRPNLYSFAHGGTNFRLHGELERIELVTGRSSVATDELLSVLRKSPDIYDFGLELVKLGNSGKLIPLTESSLRYSVGGLVQFWTNKKGRDGSRVELRDPPSPICRSVIDLRELRRLKPLIGVITAPTLRPDGSLLSARGYDATTQLLLDLSDNSPCVPFLPSLDQARVALDALWKPFRDFPFCNGLDRAVHLAALLTAAVRPVLPSSPGFAYDAPIQGSGKTLLARCVGVLAQGSDPGVWPHTAGKDDEEIRKRIFSVLRSGARVLIWDNVVGAFDSAAMASLITSPNFTDRILGQSQSSTVPNRVMLVLTGNNLLLKGEMPRRVLVSRIDPSTDQPFAREFDMEPYSYCRDNRQVMISSALILIRAYLTHGCKTKITGKLASFEDWDSWVRRTVIFCNELASGQFGDVMDSIKANQAVDPEQEAHAELLRCLEETMGKQPFTVSEVATKLTTTFPHEANAKGLKDAIEGIVGSNPNALQPRSLGKMLGYRKDRIAGGRLIEQAGKSNDKQLWRIRAVV